MAHPSLPTLIQESFWWWQCSDRYISLPLPPPPYPLPPLSPSLISLTVTVDVKHHVTTCNQYGPWRARSRRRMLSHTNTDPHTYAQTQTHTFSPIPFLLSGAYSRPDITYWLTDRKTPIYSCAYGFFQGRALSFVYAGKRKCMSATDMRRSELRWVTVKQDVFCRFSKRKTNRRKFTQTSTDLPYIFDAGANTNMAILPEVNWFLSTFFPELFVWFVFQPLSKKVPENPKFKHVRSTIDTGEDLIHYHSYV